MPDPMADAGGELEVQKILWERKRYRKQQYLVKWKGYDESHNTCVDSLLQRTAV